MDQTCYTKKVSRFIASFLFYLLFNNYCTPFKSNIEISPIEKMLKKRYARHYHRYYPIDGEGAIPKLMREYHNLYVDLSAHSGLSAISRDLDYTAGFFEEFSDRILYGTDICFADQYAGQSDFMNKMLDDGRISEEIYDKITRKNALRLLKLV